MKHLHTKGFLIGAASLAFCACGSHTYTVQSIDYRNYIIDSRYDNPKNEEAETFMAPYREKVESQTSPVIGRAACDMIADRPESKLSNFLSDILVASGSRFDEKPDLGIYNIGGIRASLSKGDITMGDVIDMSPFENKICFLTLTGKDLTTLFEQIAFRGGEGVSHEVKAVITKDGKLVSLAIKGEPVKSEATYRIATIDYLAEGNDGMPAFKLATDTKMLTDKSNNLRFVIMDYLKDLKTKGIDADSEIEGRIVEQ